MQTQQQEPLFPALQETSGLNVGKTQKSTGGKIILMILHIIRKPVTTQKPIKFDPYQDLANAIIAKAAEDYRDALCLQRKNRNSKSAKEKVDEIETFFRSDWYQVLTNIDGELLITRLREES